MSYEPEMTVERIRLEALRLAVAAVGPAPEQLDSSAPAALHLAKLYAIAEGFTFYVLNGLPDPVAIDVDNATTLDLGALLDEQLDASAAGWVAGWLADGTPLLDEQLNGPAAGTHTNLTETETPDA